MPLSPAIRRQIAAIVGHDAVVEGASGLRVYECDGYTLERAVPHEGMSTFGTGEPGRQRARFNFVGGVNATRREDR